MDFTIFGVARSGTTALASAINLHPKLFCSIEAFLPHKKINQFSFPDAFMDFDICGEKSIKHKKMISEKKTIISYGNKFPRYFAYIDFISQQFPNIINIGVYREDFNIVHSWNERVKSESNWDKGRTGIVGVFEQLAFFSYLFKSENKIKTYLFSYDKLFVSDKKHSVDLYNIFENDNSEAVESFQKNVFRKGKVINKTRFKTEMERKASVFFNIKYLDDIFYKNSGRSIECSFLEAENYFLSLEDKVIEFLRLSEINFSLPEINYLKAQNKFFKGAFPKWSLNC